MSHLGDRLSAVVDGELSHDERDRVLAHVTRCGECRELVEAERAVKARLVGLAPPPLPPTLLARLRDLPAPSGSAGSPMVTASRSDAVASAFTAPPALRARRLRRGSRRPGPGRASGSAWQRHRVASAGALVGVALAAAFAVGGEQGAGGAPVRPPVDRFSIEHASVTGTVPLVDPASLIGTGGHP